MPFGQSTGQGFVNPGVVVATTVIVEGAKGGIFVYSPSPGAGNLIGSWAAQAGTDQYGNAYPQGLAIFNEFLTIKEPARIEFPSGQAMEGTAANIAGGFNGSGTAEFLQMLLSGPKGNPAGATDWVQIQLNSSDDGATTDANLAFIYVDISGTAHLYGTVDANGFSFTGDGQAADPTVSPTQPETWKTLTLLNNYMAGANPGGFLDVPQIRLDIDNKELSVKCTLITPNPIVSNTIAAVPSNYPNANLGGNYGMGGVITNHTLGQFNQLRVQNNGNISFQVTPGTGITFDITCKIPTQ
jgi:hypothetical protein